MEYDMLLDRLQQFFPSTPDLMRHLSPGACWHYSIHENDLNDPPELEYYLLKNDDGSIILSTDAPAEKPDLILYFTEKAILQLVEDNPVADEYYSRYSVVMNNPMPGIEVDNKVNKPRLQLLKLGYKQWQADFHF